MWKIKKVLFFSYSSNIIQIIGKQNEHQRKKSSILNSGWICIPRWWPVCRGTSSVVARPHSQRPPSTREHRERSSYDVLGRLQLSSTFHQHVCQGPLGGFGSLRPRRRRRRRGRRGGRGRPRGPAGTGCRRPPTPRTQRPQLGQFWCQLVSRQLRAEVVEGIRERWKQGPGQFQFSVWTQQWMVRGRGWTA